MAYVILLFKNSKTHYVTHTMFVPCANLPKLKNTHIPLLFVIIYYRKMAKYIIKNAYYNIGML